MYVIVQEVDLGSIDTVELGFVVRPPERDVGPSLYQERARVSSLSKTQPCLKLVVTMYIHGEWEGNFQTPAGVSSFAKFSKMFKSMDDPLMERRI